jgi:hypothetical protein
MKTIKKKLLIKTTRRRNKKKLKIFIRLYSAIKIQNAFRKYQIKIRLSDIEHRVLKEPDKFSNDTTFIGKKLSEIEKVYFYIHSNYFFDIRELVQHIRHSLKHPYTNVIFNKFTINQILRINHTLMNNYENYKTLDEDNNNNLSNKNIISSLKTDIFLKIDSRIGVSNVNTFNNYDELDLYFFVENIMTFSLIKNLFNVNEILHQTHYFYNKFENERSHYNQTHSDYLDNFYKYRFRFKYHILNILLKIVNFNDNNLTTRCHIINETISRHIYENEIINEDEITIGIPDENIENILF